MGRCLPRASRASSGRYSEIFGLAPGKGRVDGVRYLKSRGERGDMIISYLTVELLASRGGRIQTSLDICSRGMPRAQRLRSVTTSHRLRAPMPRRPSRRIRCGRCGRTHSTDENHTLRQTFRGKTAAPPSMCRTGGHNCLKNRCSREITAH